MNKLFTILTSIRSFPAYLVYLSLSEDIQCKICCDYSRENKSLSFFQLHERLLKDKIFRRIFLMRVMSSSIWKYYAVRLTYQPLFSLEISSTSGKIGGGLKIYHGYSTIVFCHSMGENCTVYQNVTIGRGKKINGNDVPIIGNNVIIYTGAIVIGGITIGNNVVIGAGAVVVKDVPDDTTVVGNGVRYIGKQKY